MAFTQIPNFSWVDRFPRQIRTKLVKNIVVPLGVFNGTLKLGLQERCRDYQEFPGPMSLARDEAEKES